MSKEVTEALIAKYFRNECNEEEKEFIEGWLVDPKNRERVDRLMKSHWKENMETGKMETPDPVEVLSKIHEKIRSNVEKPTFTSNKTWYTRQWVSIAAVLLLPIISISLYYFIFTSKEETIPITYSHFENQPGQRSKINLPDGSTVWLNAASSLKFPKGFGNGKRAVELKGEAYFEVIKNPDRPFTVSTEDVQIKVLGTSFNVSAFPEDLTTETTLVTGSVALKKTDAQEDFLLLEPSQKAIFEKNMQSFSITSADLSLSTSWKDGILKFNNDPLDEVIKELQRWYGVDIKCSETLLATNKHLSFTLKDESLEKILQHINTLIPIVYAIDGSNVTITKK